MREYEYVKSLASAFLVICARGRVSTITLQSLKKVEKRKYIYSEIAIHCPLMINLNFHSGEQDFSSSSTAAYPIASPIIFPRVKFISQVLYFLFARVKRLSFQWQTGSSFVPSRPFHCNDIVDKYMRSMALQFFCFVQNFRLLAIEKVCIAINRQIIKNKKQQLLTIEYRTGVTQ